MRDRRSAFHRCLACSFVFRDHAYLPTAEAERARYTLHRNDRSDVGYLAFLNEAIDRALTDAGEGVERVLDWGSGPSAVGTELLRERGFQTDSWDPFFAADRRPAAAAYDLIVCIEAAEHFFSPFDEFQRLASFLRPGGSLSVRTLFVPSSDDLFLRWWYKEDPTHVSFYSEAAFSALAAASGLAVVGYSAGTTAAFRLGGTRANEKEPVHG